MTYQHMNQTDHGAERNGHTYNALTCCWQPTVLPDGARYDVHSDTYHHEGEPCTTCQLHQMGAATEPLGPTTCENGCGSATDDPEGQGWHGETCHPCHSAIAHDAGGMIHRMGY